MTTTDLWILVLGLGFFAVAALFVVFCDRVIGPDTDSTVGNPDTRTAEGDTVGANRP